MTRRASSPPPSLPTSGDIAARVLESIGYANVAVYADGKQDWIDAGLPVDVGVPQKQAA